MKTGLHEKHIALGAKIVDFSGWEMPLQYSKGIKQEHMAVRKGVGIFDVSHMGRVLVRGKGAEALLDYVSTNKILGKKDHVATYTVWASEHGGVVDDVIIYRRNSQDFFIIVNAGNRKKDLDHLFNEAKNFDVEITERYEEDGILAIQGPNSRDLLIELFPEAKDLKYMRFLDIEHQGENIVLSRTGYTGNLGYEFYAPNSIIRSLWEEFMEKGEKYGIEPVGLAARDTLRLEMGYALYSHELSERIAPTESVSAWTVKLDKEDFLGKGALTQLEKSPAKRSQYGIVMLDKGVARESYDVLKADKVIGTVTSGTFSPCLDQGIGIILVEGNLEEGDEVDIKIRRHLVKAKVTGLPFIDPKAYQ